MASTVADWSKLKVVDLRAELKRRGQSTAGRKDELVQRLVEDDETAAAAAANGGEQGGNDGADANREDAERRDEPKEGKIAPEVAPEAAPEAAPVPAPEETLKVAAEIPETEPKEDPEAPEETPKEAPDTESKPTLVGQTPTQQPQRLAAPPLSAVPMSEVVSDEQKRKRRSVTPPPSLHNEEVGRSKRQRIEGQVASGLSSEVPSEVPSKPSSVAAETMVAPTETVQKQDTSMHLDEDVHVPARDKGDSEVAEVDMEDAADYADTASVTPAIHPATTALYICHLMRPLRPTMLEEHLAALATPPSRAAGADDSVLLSAYLDPIKTHALVVFANIAAAARARAALHGQVWPDESNRRPLWVDFVPTESVQEWIDQELSGGGSGGGGGSRSSVKKWEVVYSEESDGHVTTTLCEAGASGANALVPGRILYDPSGPAAAAPDNSAARMPEAADMPLRRSPPPFDAPRGPKGNTDDFRGRGGEDQLPPPPLSSRGRYDDDRYNGDRFDDAPPVLAPRERRQRGGRGADGATLDDDVRTTRASPALDYQLVHADLARRRQDNIWSHTSSRGGSGDQHAGQSRSQSFSRSRSHSRSRGHQSDYTKTHNRYTFENGDELVDRGPEMFDGIRPPHRERERRQQQQRRGGGGGGGRMGGGGEGGRRRRRGRRGGGGGGGGGRMYDDYRPGRDYRDDRDRGGDRRDDNRGGGRGDRGGDNRKNWDDRRDRFDRYDRGGGGGGRGRGRDEREGRLGGYNDRR